MHSHFFFSFIKLLLTSVSAVGGAWGGGKYGGMICGWILYISSLGEAFTGPRHRDGGGQGSIG
jgi:hypothetical protein